MLDSDVAIMHKVRPAHDVAAVSQVIGKVAGKVCLMGDDMIVTGGTLLAGARALKESGATAVYVFATHAIFAGNALDLLGAQDDVEKIIVTDTVPIDRTKAADKITVLPVAPLQSPAGALAPPSLSRRSRIAEWRIEYRPERASDQAPAPARLHNARPVIESYFVPPG